MNLIAFSDPRNCVNTQYAALSGAMQMATMANGRVSPEATGGISVLNRTMVIKGIYFVIYGIISEFTDKGQCQYLKGQCQYLTNLKGPQEGTYLYTKQFLSLR